MKIFDRFQTQVKANIYEIECNTRSVINTLDAKNQDPKFYDETNISLLEANKVLDMLQKSMQMGLTIQMPNFNLRREATYNAKAM